MSSALINPLSVAQRYKSNETHSSIVDKITFAAAANAPDAHNATAILGPFFRQNAFLYLNGGSIIKNPVDDGETRSCMDGLWTQPLTSKSRV